MGKKDLEDRLINFAVACIKIAEMITKSYTGTHLSGQLIRSGTSAALNYGEAQSAESRKDFVHKMKVVLKELRESRVSLKIIQLTKLCPDEEFIQSTIDESNELISIFVTSVNTASKSIQKEKLAEFP